MFVFMHCWIHFVFPLWQTWTAGCTFTSYQIVLCVRLLGIRHQSHDMGTRPSAVSIFDSYMSYGWGSTGENVTSKRHTTWRQGDTRLDVRVLHDVTSDMSHERQDFVTWLLHVNAHPASRISQYDKSHPVRCFWILLEFRNTIVRARSRVIRDMIIEL